MEDIQDARLAADIHQYPNKGSGTRFTQRASICAGVLPFPEAFTWFRTWTLLITTRTFPQEQTNKLENKTKSTKQVPSMGRDVLSLPQPAWLLRIHTNSDVLCPVWVLMFCSKRLWRHTGYKTQNHTLHLNFQRDTIYFPPKFPFKDLPNQSTNRDSQFAFFNRILTPSTTRRNSVLTYQAAIRVSSKPQSLMLGIQPASTVTGSFHTEPFPSFWLQVGNMKGLS